ncbi:hypothetical protein D9611_005048 [Ephemerocybe angulata]|uniref:Uncharacterized protein n=1 Tax=Ephemerocybe angulata TaxID=980116 RepID=A0A8H5B361_9AGAR|nr:hypothetical protein D9611_005048 [Tulosesus angulatus]
MPSRNKKHGKKVTGKAGESDSPSTPTNNIASGSALRPDVEVASTSQLVHESQNETQSSAIDVASIAAPYYDKATAEALFGVWPKLDLEGLSEEEMIHKVGLTIRENITNSVARAQAMGIPVNVNIDKALSSMSFQPADSQERRTLKEAMDMIEGKGATLGFRLWPYPLITTL